VINTTIDNGDFFNLIQTLIVQAQGQGPATGIGDNAVLGNDNVGGPAQTSPVDKDGVASDGETEYASGLTILAAAIVGREDGEYDDNWVPRGGIGVASTGSGSQLYTDPLVFSSGFDT